MHGRQKNWRKKNNHVSDDKPKRKSRSDRNRSQIKSRLRNVDKDWEMISDRFMKGNKNESRNDRK